MEFSIRHRIKGRIRLHVPGLGQKTAVSEHLVDWLRRQGGVHDVRVNYDCAALVVSYDENRRILLDMMLAWFANATLGELKSLLASKTSTALSAPLTPAHPRPPPPAKTGGEILALPTLSLGLAFVAGPLAAAVNIPLMLWNAIPIAKRAWSVWHRERRLNVDVLDTLAIGMAF